MTFRRVAFVFAVLAVGCGTRSILGDEKDAAPRLPSVVSDASSGFDVVLSAEGGGFQDALPDVQSEACSSAPPKPPPPPGPIPHLCAPPTIFECDGLSDSNPRHPNDLFGNGFDDDCDGLVDERCGCDPGAVLGELKDCWLVPASQIDDATNEPVGWCKANSHGTVACMRSPGDAFRLVWAGTCEGASQPFFSDVCAPGDFDCDGAEGNSRVQDCSCER
jgi:hypothetical protein